MASLIRLVETVTRMRGSVVPMASKVAGPAAALAVGVKVLFNSEAFHAWEECYKINVAAFSTFSGLLGFLIVFRSSQAYTRYWNGGCLVKQMLGSWFDGASGLITYTRSSRANPDKIAEFQHKILKLFSMMTALCLARLEAGAQGNSLEEKDMDEISRRLKSLPISENVEFDEKTMDLIKHAPLKIELVFHWIQGVIVKALEEGVINVPPPICTRAFQQLGVGMVKFEDCMKICILPIPFPYSQTTVVLLMIHWILAPLAMCSSTKSVVLASCYTFFVVFTFWSLFFISMELENPFGEDENDLDVVSIQEGMNTRLMSLLSEASAQIPGVMDISDDAPALRLGALCDVDGMFGLGIDREMHSENGDHHRSRRKFTLAGRKKENAQSSVSVDVWTAGRPRAVKRNLKAPELAPIHYHHPDQEVTGASSPSATEDLEAAAFPRPLDQASPSPTNSRSSEVPAQHSGSLGRWEPMGSEGRPLLCSSEGSSDWLPFQAKQSQRRRKSQSFSLPHRPLLVDSKARSPSMRASGRHTPKGRSGLAPGQAWSFHEGHPSGTMGRPV